MYRLNTAYTAAATLQLIQLTHLSTYCTWQVESAKILDPVSTDQYYVREIRRSIYILTVYPILLEIKG